MSRITNAYAAGLVDGEGSVMLSRQKKGAMRSPEVTVTSTTLELLDFLRARYGGNIIEKKVYSNRHSRAWCWRLDYRKAIDFLGKVLPFMREKSKVARAKLLVGDYVRLTPRNGKYSLDARQAKEEFEGRFFRA